MNGIKALERKISMLQPRSLILLCSTPDGHEKKMTLQECIQTGSEFIRVVTGNNLDELDALLRYELDTMMKMDGG